MNDRPPGPGLADSPNKAPGRGDRSAPPAMSETAGADAEDLALAQAGNHEAFGRIYDRHAPVVLSLCRRLSLAEADDATQETFIRAHRLLAKVTSPEKLRPWLYGIARRVCFEQARSARRRAHHEDRHMVTQRACDLRPATADEQVGHAEQLERLGRALEQLDDRQRLAIHLFYLEADPVNAANSALGLSRSGYYKLLGRARDRLADVVGGLDPS